MSPRRAKRSADGNVRFNVLAMLSVLGCLSGSKPDRTNTGAKATVCLPQPTTFLSASQQCCLRLVHRPADFTVYVQPPKTPASSTGVNGGTYWPATPVPGDVIAAHHGVPPRQEVSKSVRTLIALVYIYCFPNSSPNSQRGCCAVRPI